MNYPWLKERKYQAEMEKRKNNSPNISSVHAGLNRDIRFTGPGNPNEVASFTPDGKPIHKGELGFGGPGRGEVITDAVSSRELMSNPVIAGRIGYGCGGYKKGYQTGGYVAPEKTDPNIIAPNTDVPIRQTVSSDIRNEGISAIRDIARGGSTAGRIAGQKQLSDLKSTQDVERQVMKQEMAQKGMDVSEAGGTMARLRGEQQGQLAEAETGIALEQLKSKEAAALTLAQQGLQEREFEEFTRQFDVGSEQWNTAFEERRRQFEVGSNQWEQSFEEQRRQYDKNFEEQIRQFDVGSAQWEKAYADRRDYQWATFDEQKRQFDVNSDQWEKANDQQLQQWEKAFDEQRRQFDVGSNQWNKSFDEERRRYDNEDERWWKTFDEQRRQFDVGSEQWNKSFDEQQRQFDVGSDQWNKAHDLRVKEFAQQVDMNKHTIDVWKDNVAYRDKAYLDSRSDAEQRLEMERAVHEKNMQALDFKFNVAENNEKSKQYWESSERVFNYVTTHIDGYDEKNDKFTWDAEMEMLKWFKDKYPGSPADKYATPADYEKGNPEFYKSFKQWAAGEWKAATDGRLTNPYDKMLYDVESSGLDNESKKIISDILTSPEALAQIAGITIDPKTGDVSIQTKEGTTTTVEEMQKHISPEHIGNEGNSGNSGNQGGNEGNIGTIV